MTLMDTESYWKNRGAGYRAEFQKHNPYTRLIFWLQERALRQELAKLKYESVLEVGCGFGRITRILLDNPNVKRVVATDLSPKQIANVNITDPRLELKVQSVLDLDYYKEFDMVIASEVLMHIPPDKIDQALHNMKKAAKSYVLNVDWYAPKEAKAAGGWCWQHDYPGKILRKLHRQAIYFREI